MGFYKDGKWQPDAAEIASGEYMTPASELRIVRERNRELERELTAKDKTIDRLKRCIQHNADKYTLDIGEAWDETKAVKQELSALREACRALSDNEKNYVEGWFQAERKYLEAIEAALNKESDDG